MSAEMKALLFSAQGRLARQQFIFVQLVIAAIYFGLPLVMTIIRGVFGDMIGAICGLLMLAVFIVTIWVSFCTVIKRLHDLDLVGWFSLITFVPLINIFFYLYLFCAKGTEGTNKYGARLV